MKTCFVTSDLHVGGGDSHDEFAWDDLFATWLADIGGPDSVLVLNGDTFVFDKIAPREVDKDVPSYLLWTVDVSMAKLEAAIAAHPKFFDALRDFVTSGAELRFTIGNHDLDLAWPEVQARILGLVDPAKTGRVSLHIVGTSFANCFIQHGHQFEPTNATEDPENFIHVGPDGKKYLERTFGIDFVLSFFNDFADDLPFAENIKPTSYIVLQGLLRGWLGWGHVVRALAFIARAGLPVKAISEFVLDTRDGAPIDPATLNLDRLDLLFPDEEVADLVEQALVERGAPTYAEVKDHLNHELRRNLVDGGLVDMAAAGAPVVEDAADDNAATVDADIVLGIFRDKMDIRNARKRIDAGYDHVVYGHSHHIVDGAELRPGNFLFNPGCWIGTLNLKDPAVKAELKKHGMTKRLLERDAANHYVTAIRAVRITDDGSVPVIEHLDD